MTILKASSDDAQSIADIVSISNKDVAEKFAINKDNNPKHPSFYNKQWALSDFDRGEEYFFYLLEGKKVGCVAFEQPNENVGYLNRLSVLPEHRHQGAGAELVKFILQYAEQKGIEEVSIGIIAEHEVLKHWYRTLGFVENGVKQFPHLPFDVMFMKCPLNK